MFNNKSVLITGGTGSFGNEFVKRIVEKFKNVKRLIIFSRDELKQEEMSKKFSEQKYKFLRYFLGDIRDKERVFTALNGVDYVVHAAALKQVPRAEYNPFEYIKTNVLGGQNLIEACIEKKVKKLVALSTDKAAAPINLYGATKLCSDKLFIAANNIKGFSGTSFSVVRYGNVIGSRGSIVDLLKKNKDKDTFQITDPDMTRFNITLKESVDHVLWSFKNSPGGDILVPKLKSYKLIDLINSFNPNLRLKKIGIRPGEKIHEEMITESDSLNTIELKKYYVILPNTFSENKILKTKSYYKKKFNSILVPKNFKYNSGNNKDFLSVKDLKKFFQN
jgi:UDP-N-acetylglucosamine 4,6-dehydratase/5-epimerase